VDNSDIGAILTLWRARRGGVARNKFRAVRGLKKKYKEESKRK
jgi:hypothetical protein